MMACESESTLNKIQNPFASKTPPQQPPKRKPEYFCSGSRVEDECYSCKEKGHWSNECPDNDGSCFSCKETGHWYRDCPNKVPESSHLSSPGGGGGSSSSSTNMLLLWCPCGQGKCRYLTCRNGRSNGKKFYACPNFKQPGDCKFFKWCEDMSMFKVPECPCGAGACSLNRKSSDEHSGWYYGCRLKRSQGACNFFQWADPRMMQTNGDGDSDHRVSNGQNADLAVNRNLIHDFEHVSTSEGSSGREIRDDETPNAKGDMVAEAPESSALVRWQAPSVASQANISDQNGEFWMQATASVADFDANVLLEGARSFSSALNLYSSRNHIPCANVYGWLGRLVYLQRSREILTLHCEGTFPSLDSVRIPEDVNISFIEDPVLESNSISYIENVVPSRQTCEQDDPLTSDIILAHNNEIVRVSHAGNSLSKSILMQFGGTLINVLESMDPQKHEQMLEIAEATFDMLCKCSIDFEVFRENVLQYIKCASMVSRLEVSMHKGLSCQEIIDKYNLEKVHFDDVSHNHAKAKDSYENSSSCILSLEKEVSRAKASLNKLEERLSICKADNAELEDCVVESTSAMSVSEGKLEALHQELVLALDLEQQRESTLDAGKAALENARSCL